MQSLRVLYRMRLLHKPTFQIFQKTSITLRTIEKPRKKDDDKPKFPRRIFSGIQPSGHVHLGNYLGAIQKWVELQNVREDVTYCIVDMHSITIDQNPAVLRDNIFEMAATMYACGLDPENNNLFVQSSVKEHSELCWILNCLCTMARLGHLPQFKEKSRKVKDVPLGLYVYPVLQAADILLYKSTHIPVGEDQVQHIQLAQHLARTFNNRYGITFPICDALIEDNQASRIRSLRNPSKKMSKSDPEPKASINIRDEPDVIVEKIKKAVTDFTSDVTYDPINRPGVSNLVAIHSLVTGAPIQKIVEESKTLDTARYKTRVAESVVEHLAPIKLEIDRRLSRKSELIHMLEMGAEKARQRAYETLEDVKQKIGLGCYSTMPQFLDVNNFGEISEEKPVKEKAVEVPTVVDGKPVVPKQKMRLENKRSKQPQITAPTFKIDLGDIHKIGSNNETTTAATSSSTLKTGKLHQIEHVANQLMEIPEKSIN